VEGITGILTEAGHEVVKLEKYPDQADLVKGVADIDALIIRSDKVTAEVIAAAPRLKIVVRAGAGYDNVDLAAARAKGIVVMNTPGQNSNAVAELALGMMVFMARTQFTPATGSELLGKRLGVQAYGHVDRLVGEKAKALGMSVSALDPFLSDEQILAGGATPVHSVEELYAAADYLSIHIPALPSTIGSIGYDLITRMPKGATLINTARKEVIDEEGLMKALEDRPDLKYVTDVMPDNYAALQEKFGLRVFATPKKMGAQTAEANINAGLAAARQIADFFATGNTRFQVNK
jgi:D-3-phosphoglycerate dehydrogenase